MRSLNSIIPRLLHATDGGRLTWEHAKSASKFFVNAQGVNIEIWEWTDQNSPENIGVTIRLIDHRGTELDEIMLDQFSAQYPQLRELYLAARRSALKVDEVIGKLDNYLKLLGP
jgi:hypothetical protein